MPFEPIGTMPGGFEPLGAMPGDDLSQLPEIGELDFAAAMDAATPGGATTREKFGVGMTAGIAQNFLKEKDLVGFYQNLFPNMKVRELTDQERKTYETDSPILEINGQQYWLNKPGPSFQDFTRPAAQIGGFLGLGKLFAPLAGGKLAAGTSRFMGTMTGAAAAGAGISIGQEQLNEGLLPGEQDLDVADVGKDAALSALGQGIYNRILAPLGRGAFNVVKNRFGNDVVQLSDDAVRALQEAGLDPSGFTDDQVRAMNDMVKSIGTNLDDASKGRALGQTAIGVNPTRGQVLQTPVAQRKEAELLQGGVGVTQSAADTMAANASNQGQTIINQADAIVDDIARGATGGVPTTQGALRTAADSALSSARSLYRAARGGKATVDPDAVGRFTAQLDDVLGQRFHPRRTPEVQGMMRELNGMTERFANAADADEITVRELFEWRQGISSIARGGGEDSAAAGQALDLFDEFALQLRDSALVSGDDAVINTWRQALKEFKDFKVNFEAKDLVGRLIRRDRQTGLLAVDPDDAANFLLNSSDLGFVTKPKLTEATRKIGEILGRDSEGFNALRAAVSRKLMNNLNPVTTGAGRTEVSGRKLLKAWENARMKAGPLLDALYTKQEQAQMANFAKIADSLTSKVKGGEVNSSTGLIPTALRPGNLTPLASLGPGLARWLPILKTGVAGVGHGLRTFNNIGAVDDATQFLTAIANRQPARGALLPLLADGNDDLNDIFSMFNRQEP